MRNGRWGLALVLHFPLSEVTSGGGGGEEGGRGGGGGIFMNGFKEILAIIPPLFYVKEFSFQCFRLCAPS